MRGMDGDDSYKVETAGDRAVEDSEAGGVDTVFSTISYTIGANVENLTLTGSGETTAVGNALANILTGNARDNGLEGDNGNDRLDGGAGADRMTGGNGDDLFIVDDAADKAIETSAAGGIDRVESSVSFTLGANIENLTLTGTTAVRATGNALANSLTGNAAANSLNGGSGADRMDGRGGNDTYFVDHAGDLVIELLAVASIDLVNSSVSFTLGANVENLTLTGTAAYAIGNPLANLLTGNGWANAIKGGGGRDTLVGGGGGDTLSGGQGGDLLRGGDGGDSFLFDALLGAGNIDHLADLARGADRIVLDNRVFQSLADGALAGSAFKLGSAATDATDRIIYDPSNGAL
jgi:Ca2+-binding RTX toxin-like protein